MSGSAVPEMRCADLVEVVTDVLESRLGAMDRARFDAHLAECSDCAEYVSQFRRTVDALSRLRVDELALYHRP